jgi:hypothetical protein
MEFLRPNESGNNMNAAQATVRDESAQSTAISDAETASTTERSAQGAIWPGVLIEKLFRVITTTF